MPRLLLTRLCLLLALLSGVALGDAPQPVLTYTIQGLDGKLLDNARAYLGEAPLDEADRSNFLFSARDNLRESVNALGYYEPYIELKLERTEPTWRLVAVVEPGEPVRLTEVDIQLLGPVADDEAFQALLAEESLSVGQRLDHGRYETFKRQLIALGQERGYMLGALDTARVSVDVEAGEARVALHYESGPRFTVGEITADEFPLDQKQIDRLRSFETGDPFDIADIQTFQAGLQRTGFFSTALVRPGIPDTQTHTVPIHIDLERAVRHRYNLGIGYSTDIQERISLTWRTPLINSKGHRQETRLEYSPIRPRGRFTYTIPLTHPTDDILQLRARLENNQYGDLESFQEEVGVGRDFVRGNWLLSTNLRYLEEEWDIGFEDKRNAYTLPGITFSHTLRGENVIDPEYGFFQLYGVELGSAEAGSDLDLLRMYGSWRAAFTLMPRHRIYARAELGAVLFEDGGRPDLAPSLSFFAGGDQSIRGYGYQSLGPTQEVPVGGGKTEELVVGGDRLAVLSGEYQYYVNDTWRAAFFVDTGNAFNGSDFKPVVGTGFGVHYLSPVGAIKVDIGNAISEDRSWRLHLTMGAEF